MINDATDARDGLRAKRASALRDYMTALGNADYQAICRQFTTDGLVTSPFLGTMPAGQFFDQLGRASSNNAITPIDLFFSGSDADHAIAYFRYDWTMADGSVVVFNAMDLFGFQPETAQFTALDIIYDTHPIRSEHGDKYQNLAAGH